MNYSFVFKEIKSINYLFKHFSMTTLILKQENSSFCRELYHKNKSQFDMFSKEKQNFNYKS